MPVSIDWSTLMMTVPQSDLTFVSGTLYSQNTNDFRLELKAIEASEEGMPFEDITQHNTEITIAGVTYARSIEIINGYEIQYEAGIYAVLLEGSNNNFFDEGIITRNTTSIIPTNSAGLQIVTQGSGLSAPQALQLSELWQRLGLDVANDLTITDTEITVDGITLTITQPDGATTKVTRQP